VEEKGVRDGERSVGVAKVCCWELWWVVSPGPSPLCFSRSLPASLSFSGCLAPWSITFFCQHRPVSCRLLCFLSTSLPFWLPSCYYFILLPLPSSLFLGKIAVVDLPLPTDLHLFSVTPSALLPVTLPMSFPWYCLSDSLSRCLTSCPYG